jgi:hypothetical protein
MKSKVKPEKKILMVLGVRFKQEFTISKFSVIMATSIQT